MNAGLYMPLQTTVAKWFSEKRGLALGSLTTGAAFGGAVLVPLTAWLITDYGWRTAVVVLAIAAMIIGWAMSFILKPRGPEHYGLMVDGKKVESGAEAADQVIDGAVEKNVDASGFGLSLGEAIRTQAFWWLVAAFLFSHTAHSAIVVHQIPFIEDMGISKVVAAAALGTMTLMSAPGRFSAGWLADRWNLKYLYIIANVVSAIGLVIFSNATSMSLVWTFVAIYGFSFGLRVPLEAAMRARYFGSKAFGSIMGYMNFFAVFGAFGGPFFAGWIFDTTGTYMSAFLTFAGILVIGAVVVLFIKSPIDHHGSIIAGATE